MGKDNSNSMSNQIIVGVVTAVLTAIILAWLGLGKGDNPPPQPPPPQTQMANYCCDVYGNKRCQLVTPVAQGTPCVCAGVYGTGTACQ